MVNEPVHLTLDAILGTSRHFEDTRLQSEGPAGKLRDSDVIGIVIDRRNLTGSINFVGMVGEALSFAEADASLVARPSHPHLQPHPDLPDDTRLWAALQRASGGMWAGCIYDVDKIIELIDAGLSILAEEP